MNPTRRRLIAALAATPWLAMARDARPDLILHHANVITIDPKRPRAGDRDLGRPHPARGQQ